jgi:hypothetical protein
MGEAPKAEHVTKAHGSVTWREEIGGRLEKKGHVATDRPPGIKTVQSIKVVGDQRTEEDAG